MRPGDHFPGDQAFIDLTDAFLESINLLTSDQREQVLAEVVALCANPGGLHPLSNTSGQKLAGLSTVEVLGRQWRVVFRGTLRSTEAGPVGQIEVLVAGPRRGAAVYDAAEALRRSGRLTDDEMQEIWEALALLEVVAEDVGLDGWDYRPPPAPEGVRKAAVAAGVVEPELAEHLSLDELNAAMSAGWGPDGPDQASALEAVLLRARAGIEVLNVTEIFTRRGDARCGAIMKRTRQACIRRLGHPGAHRATP